MSDNVSIQEKSTAEFYDLRGKRAFMESKIHFGSEHFSWAFRYPYEYFERKIATGPGSSGGMSFLDLCCGTGVHSLAAVKRGYRVTGVDISTESIEAAVRARSITNQSEAVFEKRDVIEFLQINQVAEYDLVFMSGSVYYFELAKLFSAVMPRIKAGGKFVCIETNGENKVLNLVRNFRSKIDPARRDRTTLSNLLKAKDIDEMSKYFSSIEIRYFDFLVLFAAIFSRFPKVEKFLVKLLRPLDEVMLNKMGMHSMAFKFIFTGHVKHD